MAPKALCLGRAGTPRLPRVASATDGGAPNRLSSSQNVATVHRIKLLRFGLISAKATSPFSCGICRIHAGLLHSINRFGVES
jgi:hypothetical protein